jgi:capsular polysaccharide biosynthesis protein
MICDYTSKDVARHNQNKVILKHTLSKDKIESALFLGCNFPTNYYHFLLELVSRIAYIESIPDHKKLPILITEKVLQFESLKKIIEIFFQDYTIIYLNENCAYEVNNLWYITSPNTVLPNVLYGGEFEAKYAKIRPESIDYLRNKSINFFKTDYKTTKIISKIFIKRKSETRSYNQNEIEECALNYGFESIYFEDLSFEEQVFILQNADYVVGPTGAAWTNLIFAKAGAKGLIWAGSNWGNASVFSTLAEIVNFDLNYMFFESKSKNHHENYTLNLQFFEQNLIHLINE